MPLANHPIKQLKAWHQQFMVDKIQPILLEKAQKVVGGFFMSSLGSTNLVLSLFCAACHPHAQQ
jgi:hypothetical protein